jgi:aspartate/tyrosine/aromatic aminotransferase
LKTGIANTYPNIEGVPSLKRYPDSFLFFLILMFPKIAAFRAQVNKRKLYFFHYNFENSSKQKLHFISRPGIPSSQTTINGSGFASKSLDVYDYRGDKLKGKLEEILSEGNISSILYSNPNNPSWICFTDRELRIIGELSTKYDVIVLEDLAYFNMDFRVDHSKPGEPPFQPSVAKYTDNYILLISSSKIFSYAGQRIGSVAVSKNYSKETIRIYYVIIPALISGIYNLRNGIRRFWGNILHNSLLQRCLKLLMTETITLSMM